MDSPAAKDPTAAPDEALPRKSGTGLSSVSIGLVVLLVAFMVVQGVLESRSKRQFLPVGQPAPEFTMSKLTGGEVTLSSLKGKVVMLDFWATWCPPCVEEMPSLVKLAKEYEARGVVFVAANRDDADEARAKVSVFSQRRVPDLPPFVAFPESSTAIDYKVVALPTLYFLDRQGRVVAGNTGYATERQLRQRLENALAQ
jgi:thiol-disulfide isomerase/thioredoxin